MKLTLAHDHKLPTGALGLAITPDGSLAFAACADGALYSVDTTSGKVEAFEEGVTENGGLAFAGVGVGIG